MLVWRRFGAPLIPICAPLFSIRVPLVPICVTLSTSSPLRTYFCLYPPHPISRYFCKESLMTPTPPNTLAHFKSLYCYCYPSKNFHRTISFIFHCVHSFSIHVHSCSFVFHLCSLVFIRVHSCSLVFIRVPLVFIRVPLVFIRVPLVFTRVHSCSLVFIRVPFVFTRVHSCSLVFIRVHSCSTRVHSCSLVFTRVHSCSLVFRSVWCFRYDPPKVSDEYERILICLKAKTNSREKNKKRIMMKYTDES